MGYKQQIEQRIFASGDDALEIIESWKANGEKIVFSNGCFDIVHRGHIDYLSQAADLGQRFVIGLNSDSSVRGLKGNDRPINNEDARAFLLSSLCFVDAVILFQESTPYNLIKQIVPNVLVKGNDYTVDQIAGSDVVLNNGGEVITVELTPGYSSSSIIQKMAKDNG
ncbi:D-glycero-beta-D-manno-heptose 1-phosphate adenylyltransferase [Prolixibacteraceae bacterium JC049]|nr:D-glycero-beta-D-manno-heptose 1-phosphate adenylyltransferase [Prolixibacteraceae bacterium JC049]